MFDIELVTDVLARPQEVGNEGPRLSTLYGCLKRLSELANISEHSPPLDNKTIQRLIEVHSRALPSDYIEIVRQSEGLRIGAVKILGIQQLGNVVLPEYDICILAELSNGDRICIDESAPQRGTMVLRDGDTEPTTLAGSFCDVVSAEIERAGKDDPKQNVN